MTKKIMVVVGARPNFMKAMPILSAIRRRNAEAAGENGDLVFQPILVHTGQHYDRSMSEQFFADLGLPEPDFHLGVGSGTHAQQTAEIMRQFEKVSMAERPDVIVLVGDVNSTLACALVASKIAFDVQGSRPIIAHVEAGLRSFDRSMPEEINRIVTDQLSDVLFVTEQSAIENLKSEGISSDKIHFVGNTMIDSLRALESKADDSTILDKLGLRSPENERAKNSLRKYALVTLHRPSNVDEPGAFRDILDGISDLAASYPVIFPVHPRTKRQIQEFDFGPGLTFEEQAGSASGACKCQANGLRLVEPLGYLDFLCLMKNAVLVVTDSGGIQEETTSLGTPCVTVRKNTERPVTVMQGTNRVAGVKAEGIREAIGLQLQAEVSQRQPQFWDGKSAERIVTIMERKLAAVPGHTT